MKVQTKKYKLESADYLRLGMVNITREWWWAFLVPVALAALTFVWPNTNWFWISALIITVLYLLFWMIQFSGVTQMEQFKIMFEKMNYEIDSRQIVMKLNPKQGMPINWDQIKSGRKAKDSFLLVLSKAQFVHLPFKIFNNANDIKFVESILRRKGLIK